MNNGPHIAEYHFTGDTGHEFCCSQCEAWNDDSEAEELCRSWSVEEWFVAEDDGSQTVTGGNCFLNSGPPRVRHSDHSNDSHPHRACTATIRALQVDPSLRRRRRSHAHAPAPSVDDAELPPGQCRRRRCDSKAHSEASATPSPDAVASYVYEPAPSDWPEDEWPSGVAPDSWPSAGQACRRRRCSNCPLLEDQPTCSACEYGYLTHGPYLHEEGPSSSYHFEGDIGQQFCCAKCEAWNQMSVLQDTCRSWSIMEWYEKEDGIERVTRGNCYLHAGPPDVRPFDESGDHHPHRACTATIRALIYHPTTAASSKIMATTGFMTTTTTTTTTTTICTTTPLKKMQSEVHYDYELAPEGWSEEEWPPLSGTHPETWPAEGLACRRRRCATSPLLAPLPSCTSCEYGMMVKGPFLQETRFENDVGHEFCCGQCEAWNDMLTVADSKPTCRAWSVQEWFDEDLTGPEVRGGRCYLIAGPPTVHASDHSESRFPHRACTATIRALIYDESLAAEVRNMTPTSTTHTTTTAVFELSFPAPFYDTDLEAFERDLLAGLRSLGSRGATLDAVSVRLRAGSIIAVMTGPPAAIAELEGLQIEQLVVQGFQAERLQDLILRLRREEADRLARAQAKLAPTAQPSTAGMVHEGERSNEGDGENASPIYALAMLSLSSVAVGFIMGILCCGVMRVWSARAEDEDSSEDEVELARRSWGSALDVSFQGHSNER